MKDKWSCRSKFLVLIFLLAGSARAGIEDDLARALLTRYQLDPFECRVEMRKNPFASDVSYDSLAINPITKSEPRGLFSTEVILYRENREVGRGQARLHVAHFAEVLVTLEKIKRQEMMLPEKCRLERREVTSMTEKPLRSMEELKHRRTRRGINAGQIVTGSMLEAVPDIVSGHEVTLLYQSPRVEVQARGVALDSGCRGDQIKVRNIQSGKIIKGIVLDDRTVGIGNL